MPRKLLAATALILAGAAWQPVPALAQDSGERVNQLIVYGDDPCPVSADDQITVCARKEEAERFRIPEPLRGAQSPQNEAWNNRVLAYETVVKSGALSCTPTGGGGWTGCLDQMIKTAYAEKAGDANVRFSELIAAERERRLSTIDAEASAAQARVEEAERAYEARERARQEAEAAAKGALPPGDGK